MMIGKRLRLLCSVLSVMVLCLFVASPPAEAKPGRGAVVLDQTQVGDRQVDLTVRSPALGDSVKVRLLTPDGWEDRTRRDHWPVLYLLHGCCGDYTSWTSFTDVAEIDALRDVLVVMPEAGNTGWYSDWWNYGQGGSPAWETFHLDELRPLLEHGYGAGRQRAVAGLSMGGLGALLYAGRNPGLFSAAASYSGAVHPLAENGPEWVLGFMEQYGFDPLRLWGDPVRQRKVWEAHDPAYLTRHLRHIPIYLSCGNGEAGPFDEPGPVNALERDFLDQNEQTAAAIRAAGGEVITDFYGPGQHGWAYWERALHDSLPMLLDALDRGHR
jgi:diacylglycerol O-acyltransferase/trehalose O-mycolyltransferase